MELLRLVSIPVLIGFMVSLKFNPLLGVAGLVIWLLVIAYLLKRWQDSAEQ